MVLSSLRSRHGAANRVLRGMLTGEFAFALSSSIVLEYEDVLKRPGMLGATPWIERSQIDVILDAMCACGKLVEPWFKFRPFLDDPKDDPYIDCALASGASVILSRDKHFRHPRVAAFGLRVMTSGEFLANPARSISN